jgi:hypothetical protein
VVGQPAATVVGKLLVVREGRMKTASGRCRAVVPAANSIAVVVDTAVVVAGHTGMWWGEPAQVVEEERKGEAEEAEEAGQ